MQVEQRLPSYGPVLEKLTDRVPTDAAVRAFLGVSWEHLHAMLVALHHQHGSVEWYVIRTLGLDAVAIHNIRLRLLESR